jgi:superfamily II DNA or RNA helicase
MQTEISHHGYSIVLKSIPSHFLENIKTDLTVKPLENPNFLVPNASFPVYRLSKNKIYLPRFYGIEKYNQSINVIQDGAPINLTFTGTLRDIQEHTIKESLIAFEKVGSGIISLDTGLGKTVVALKLISLMKQKTLIVVHAEFLLEQWIARIKQFLPDARIGTIRQERCEIENVDITVGMLQTIIKRDTPFKDFGLMAIDECFPYNQLIKTSIGLIKIGILYNLWKSNQELPLILSFNELTNDSEYKKMTYAWEKINENLLEISYLFEFIQCTENHKILTPNGYIEANKLKVGDLIRCEIGIVKINSISPIKNENKFVYDIEVSDNHNFICNNLGPIVHNCHHICAKSFSNLFYKIQTKYMVGLSATPIRKDGLSKVLYWFLGPQIVNIKRETGKPTIQFINADITGYIEKFNKLGKINSPTMITDLTKIITRNSLIKSVILSLKDRKTLVLSDRREHCEHMLLFLQDSGITAGLYLGGMKTDARELTTTFSVILGTYQACGEGFDVPELDTLILATPKSDVEQAVGRILRQKNKNEPLVIDIVDSFSIFKGQYFKRRKFYKSQEFKLI